jgi:hypothetical protein
MLGELPDMGESALAGDSAELRVRGMEDCFISSDITYERKTKLTT